MLPNPPLVSRTKSTPIIGNCSANAELQHNPAEECARRGWKLAHLTWRPKGKGSNISGASALI
jgi:hypothetical protein